MRLICVDAPFFSDDGQAYVQAPGYGYLCGALLGLRSWLGLTAPDWRAISLPFW